MGAISLNGILILMGLWTIRTTAPTTRKALTATKTVAHTFPLHGDGEEGLFGVDEGTIMLALGGLGTLLISDLGSHSSRAQRGR